MNTINTTMSLINGGFTLATNAGRVINQIPNRIFYSETTRDKHHNIKKQLDFSKEQLDKILSSNSNRVPILVIQAKNSRLPNLEKNKFLVDSTILVSEFKYMLQRKLNLKFTEALFLFINFELVNNMLTISELYNKNKQNDNVLYLTYCEENVFG